MLHKPSGYLSNQDVRAGYPSWAELVKTPEQLGADGRLDQDSEEGLLLTNDSELPLRLMHPRYEHAKTYLVEVEGWPDHTQGAALAAQCNVKSWADPAGPGCNVAHATYLGRARRVKTWRSPAAAKALAAVHVPRRAQTAVAADGGPVGPPGAKGDSHQPGSAPSGGAAAGQVARFDHRRGARAA